MTSSGDLIRRLVLNAEDNDGTEQETANLCREAANALAAATRPGLAERMRQLAETDVAHAAELRTMADQLDAAWGSSDVPVKKAMGVWARARLRWHEITGEPLV